MSSIAHTLLSTRPASEPDGLHRIEHEVGGDTRRLLRPRDPEPTVGLERARHRGEAAGQLGTPGHEEHDHVEVPACLLPDLHALGEPTERAVEAGGRGNNREPRALCDTELSW